MYTHTTYSKFRSFILARLGDGVFYTDTEISRYALETLRTWNSLAQFSRDRGTLNTTASIAFYDLPSLLKSGSTYLVGYNLLDQDLLKDMKYALMEDASTYNSWTGTSQFTLLDCQDAIEKARNEFILKTGLIASHAAQLLSSPPVERVSLDDSIIEVLRVAYVSTDVGAKYSPLTRSNELSASQWINSWSYDFNNPQEYSVFLTPKISLSLMPAALNGGTLSLVTLSTPSTTLDLSTGVLLNIPDDWTWAIKWKALFYLLTKDGEATDQFRADYCQSRFEEAIIGARISSIVQQGYLNGRPMLPCSLESLDRWNRSWESTLDVPTQIACAGRNLLAISPLPDNVYGIMLDVVRNFPIPIADSDYIQVGREHLSTLVDYAVHLGMFKQGGGEFQATLPLKDNLIQLAMEHNQRLKAQAKDLEVIKKQGFKQEIEVPIYAKPSGVANA